MTPKEYQREYYLKNRDKKIAATQNARKLNKMIGEKQYSFF